MEDAYGELKVEPDGGIEVDWPSDIVSDIGRTDWDVAINDTVATDPKVDADAAKTEADLSGPWTHDLTADLEADAGQVMVQVAE